MLVSSAEELKKAVAYDHVCATYQNNHRSNKDFISSDCIPLDLDNTHSDSPSEWKTLNDIKTAFPNVPFYAVESRNHMKQKGDKAPRPRYHLYFPSRIITDSREYARLKDWAVKAFPYFDKGAVDAARFFYGVENPQVHFSHGTVTIDSFLPWSGIAPPEDEVEGEGKELHSEGSTESYALPDVIACGERNNTLFQYAFRLYLAGLNKDEISVLVEHANSSRCAEPLEQHEISTIISSACRNEPNRLYIDRVEAIMAFTEAAKEQGQLNNTAEGGERTDVICLEDVEEKTPEWLIPGYLPRGEITVMAGDGGTGKTFCWCGIAASVSSGQKCFILNNTFPDSEKRDRQKVLFFSSEDSCESILLPRLRESGAELKNIITIDVSDDQFSNVTLTSPLLQNLLAKYRPALCVFDPLQSFLPKGTSMIARSDMRRAMSRLHVYGKEYGTSFLIVMHTNKKSDVWGRNRLADSADIWDIARSVLVVGKCDEKGIMRYLSQEKSSYGRECQTVLFRIDGNSAAFASFSDKKDRDFVIASTRTAKEAPARNAAEQFIVEFLTEHGESPLKELDDAAAGNLISSKTLRSAKEALKTRGEIAIRQAASGFGHGTKWLVRLSEQETT